MLVDWKSDIAPTEQDLRDHARQLSDYLEATGAARRLGLYDTRHDPVDIGAGRGEVTRTLCCLFAMTYCHCPAHRRSPRFRLVLRLVPKARGQECPFLLRKTPIQCIQHEISRFRSGGKADMTVTERGNDSGVPFQGTDDR